MFLAVILAILSIVIILDFSIKRKKNEIARKIQGPLFFPIIGNLFVFTIRTVDDSVANMHRLIGTYGKTVRLWMFDRMTFYMTDPKALEVILTSSKYIQKNTIYDFLRSWLGDGLLVSSGRKWFQRRKILTPAFHFKILEDFVEIFDEQSAVMINCLKDKSEKGAFDISPFITLSALDIISETAMGTKINSLHNPDCEYARAVCTISDVAMERFIKPYLRNDKLMAVIAPGLKRKQDKAIKVLHSFTQKIINERRESLLKNNNQENKDEFGSKRKMALLDILLQSTIDGKPLSNADIQEEVDTFMFEGHDTTTSGIGFALYCLSRYPDIQAKVIAEIREVIGDDKTKPITLKDLNDLQYLELVLKESMRLYPPVPLIGRRLDQDLHFDDKTIPKGSDIFILIFILLHDPDFFPDPEKFNPNRHSLEGTLGKLNPYAYIPFSAGPRNCIGQKFAMLEMKSSVAKILRHFELLPLGDEPKIFPNLITRSTNGINLGIKPRVYV